MRSESSRMRRRLLPFLVLVSVVASASDLKYTKKIKDASGEHGEMTLYFQGERIRIDGRNEVGYGWKNGRPENIYYGPRTATIYQCDMHRILRLDFDHHQYTVTELDRSQPAPAMSKSGAKVNVLVESRDTGVARQLFGLTARHFIITRRTVPGPGACVKPSESTEDGWFVDIPQPQPQSGCGQPTSPAGAVAAYVVATTASCGWDEHEVQHTGPQPPPSALELSFTRQSEGVTDSATTVVTDLSRLPLDPQVFDLPMGYKHVDKLDESPSLPYLLRAKLMWQSVKTTVWGWTPWGK